MKNLSINNVIKKIVNVAIEREIQGIDGCIGVWFQPVRPVREVEVKHE